MTVEKNKYVSPVVEAVVLRATDATCQGSGMFGDGSGTPGPPAPYRW